MSPHGLRQRYAEVGQWFQEHGAKILYSDQLQGIPDSPRAWLQTVARRRAIDSLRREVRYREKLAELDQPIPQEPDNRLELIFMCCHPALAAEAQIALTLRAVCALTTPEIASAFLVSE